MPRTHRFFSRASRHIRPVAAAIIALALALGVIGPMVANTDDPSFDPEGELFDVMAIAGDTLRSDSTIEASTFLVEASDGGDVLTAAAFREWKAASARVRSGHGAHLVDRYDAELGSTIPGVVSIVDLVDRRLPDGLAVATDDQVKVAIGELLDPNAPTADFRFTLSELAAVSTGADGLARWTAPAFITSVVYDTAGFDGEIDTQLWLRDVQADFRAAAVHTDSIGVGIDIDAAFDEAVEASSPFIFLTVALIVLLVAAVHRSYWSAVIAAGGLGITMLAYNGVAALIGLQMGSLLLAFIVPIAMISFGVDFYIHGSGRVREMQLEEGMDRRDAYPAGMTAVFTAMLLAALTSIAAFLSNAISGTEAIVEFGIGAAIALGLAYLILGHLAPRLLMAVEEFVGPNPAKGRSSVFYRMAMLPVAVISGLAVTLAAVMPTIGAAAMLVLVGMFVTVPALLTRRRNRRASAAGLPATTDVAGAAHGLRPVGTIVHGLSRWRAVTLPVALALGAAGTVAAMSVESGFELRDFLSSDTDFVQSIDRVEQHFPAAGGGDAFIYIEGDLTQPDTLAALDETVAAVGSTGAEFARDADGGLITGPYATDLVRLAVSSPATVAAVGAEGITVTDTDGDGLPDDPAQVLALYEQISAHGVLTAGGELAYAPDEVSAILATTADDAQATALRFRLSSFTDGEIILPAQDALLTAAADLEAGTTGLDRVGVSGETLTQYESLESFSRSMLVSLPIAIALTLLIATVVLRSVRYAIAAVIPIGFVVVGVYAFMVAVGFKVNVVTATIAAIAVGVGIDFSTHFTARYREELATSRGRRLEAVRRSGEGTGGALVLSALTSVLGFSVMAFAPTPMFATYGILTAVMVALALIASLTVLPAVLVAVTPSRQAAAATSRVRISTAVPAAAIEEAGI